MGLVLVHEGLVSYIFLQIWPNRANSNVLWFATLDFKIERCGVYHLKRSNWTKMTWSLLISHTVHFDLRPSILTSDPPFWARAVHFESLLEKKLTSCKIISWRCYFWDEPKNQDDINFFEFINILFIKSQERKQNF